MNLIKFLFIYLLIANVAHSAEKQMNAKQVKGKFGVVEGQYKLTPGSHKNCVSGDLEIFEGNKGILSLKMGDGFLAKHLDVFSYKDSENGCTLKIMNSKIKNGFSNSEIMTCKNPKSSYSRSFKAEFIKNKFNYEMRFKRAKNAGKTLKACYLVKVK